MVMPWPRRQVGLTFQVLILVRRVARQASELLDAQRQLDQRHPIVTAHEKIRSPLWYGGWENASHPLYNALEQLATDSEPILERGLPGKGDSPCEEEGQSPFPGSPFAEEGQSP